MASIIVADHGAHTLRLGFAKDAMPRLQVPNQVAVIRNDGRELVAEETEADTLRHHEMLEYKRAHQRGCLLDVAVAEKVWTRSLSQLGGFTTSDSRSLIVTEPPVIPNASKRFSDELFFEKLRFDSVARVCAQACVAADWFSSSKPTLEKRPLVQIVIDCGYSVTWIVPLVDGNACLPKKCKRVDVGGKLLTNLLKEELTWRHVNLMDSTHLVEKCKRDVCFVKPFRSALSEGPVEYLLPDHDVDVEGRLMTELDESAIDRSVRTVLRLTAQERSNIPEILFRPSRIGLDEAGIAEAVTQCINGLPWELHEMAGRNLLLTGGSAQFPGFASRLEEELEALSSPQDWSEHFKSSAWCGAKHLATSPAFAKMAVSRKQYEEEGSYYQPRPSLYSSSTVPSSKKQRVKSTNYGAEEDATGNSDAWWA